jgi:hypothetical protein
MQAHDVVDAEKTGAPELVANAADPIAVPLLATSFGVEWMKSPILAARENRIRWSTHVDIPDESLLLVPHVETVWVDAQR